MFWKWSDFETWSHDRAYHNPNPIHHLARVLGDADRRAHIQELQDRLQIPLYHSALRPAKVPAHLQKRRIQLLRKQLPFLTLQLEAVRRAAAQMVHRKHLLLTHVEQLTNPTAREHMQRLIHYHAVHDPDVH